MQQFCQYGSVRGATGNRRPYRDDGFCGEMLQPQSGALSAKSRVVRGFRQPLRRLSGFEV